MPPEDHKRQKKIQCWVPLKTWDKIVSLGYTSPTIAVTKAFEKLLEEPLEESLIDPLVSPESHIISPEIPSISPEGYKRDIEGYKENIKFLNSEIERLQAVIMEAPDPLELAQLRARYEELEKHNSTLKGELEKAHQDKENIQNIYDNYMRQIQTLIQQKAIEAPAAQKSKPWYKFW